jgi:peptidyl-prolyl cis-trans isomerase-like protein 2
MANSGKNTNRSQFFLCFRACRHLDNVHSIFAKVVGGMAVLDRIEKESFDAKTNKPTQPLTILKATVFANPLEEATAMLEALVRDQQDKRATAMSKRTLATGGAVGAAPEAELLRVAAAAAADRKGWHSTPTPQLAAAETLASSLASAAASSAASFTDASALGGVGKYLGKPATLTTLAVGAPQDGGLWTVLDEPAEKAPKKAKATAYGNFSGW